MWGYTKVNARVLLGGNSVGVHPFLPVNECTSGNARPCNKIYKSRIIKLHSDLPLFKHLHKVLESLFSVLTSIGNCSSEVGGRGRGREEVYY